MRFGVHLAHLDLPGGPGSPAWELTEIGRACDDAGVDVVSCMDHFFGLPYLGSVTSPMLEGYTTLGFLAGVTQRVELQLLVTGVTYRDPALLAATLATLDVLSQGRAVAGLGAAWYEREHRGLGVPFPPLRDRFTLLEQTCRLLRRDPAVRRIPLMIGGVGERKALRIVAEYADACNLFAGGGSGPDFVAGKLDVLAQHCRDVGRSPDEVRATILWTPDLDPHDAGFVEEMRAMAAVGVTEVHVAHHGADPVGFVRALADHIVPALHKI